MGLGQSIAPRRRHSCSDDCQLAKKIKPVVKVISSVPLGHYAYFL